MPPPTNVTNEREWAAKTAMRLRIVQATLAELAPDSPGREVWEFISAAMQELGGADEGLRKKCMKALDEEFPFFSARPEGEGVGRGGPAPASAARPSATPAELVRQLVSASAGLSPAEKEKFSQQLAAAGLGLGQADAGPGAGQTLKAPVILPIQDEEQTRLKRTVERILDKLAVDPARREVTEELNLTRSMQMLGLMLEQYLILHPNVWSLWDKLSSSQQHTTSFNKPALPAAQALAEFLKGSSTTRRADVGEMVAKSNYLINALLLSVVEAGHEFAVWFFQKFGPESIESVMSFETRTGVVGPADYWRRYNELTRQYNESEMEEQFQKMLGKAMLRHLQRRPGTASSASQG